MYLLAFLHPDEAHRTEQESRYVAGDQTCTRNAARRGHPGGAPAKKPNEGGIGGMADLCFHRGNGVS